MLHDREVTRVWQAASNHIKIWAQVKALCLSRVLNPIPATVNPSQASYFFNQSAHHPRHGPFYMMCMAIFWFLIAELFLNLSFTHHKYVWWLTLVGHITKKPSICGTLSVSFFTNNAGNVWSAAASQAVRWCNTIKLLLWCQHVLTGYMVLAMS